MAKFFVTNNRQYYKSLKEQIGNTNFQISFDYAEEGLYSIAVHKIGMHNQNAVQKGNDFCIATGTCIYKESLDYLPLLNDFNEVAQVRELSLGQYAVAMRKKTVYLFMGMLVDAMIFTIIMKMALGLFRTHYMTWPKLLGINYCH